ncbi:MAG: 6-carboxy-5,6,7,8-tetrahydropterin synthase [Oligoflexia bacterium]|nr:MAG: 6-carboxy-5,6,7,8-tetrahydropterin synthase [Oligoflexia bacterium]
MKIELKQKFFIESARFLPLLPKSHPCAHMHGHSFQITFRLQGETNELGWLIDYNDIQKSLKPLLSQIDHKVLNEVPGLENPTTENLCVWLFDRSKKIIPQIVQVSIAETRDSECIYPVLG